MATLPPRTNHTGQHQLITDPKRLVCSKCWNFCFSTAEFQELCLSKRQDSVVTYKFDRQNSSDSVSRGCEWCSLIDHFDEESQSIVPPDFQGDTNTVEVHFRKGLLHEVFTPEGNNRYNVWVNGAEFWLTATATEDSTVSDVVTARPAHMKFTSGFVFQRIHRWLQTCSTHPECGPILASPLPTRLIEVAPEDNGGQVRIAVTKGLRGRYAVLSYCWGGKQEGMTRKDNLSARLQRIDPKELSRSILQAIETTRCMGLRYVWIDAICIIQDDEQDRVNEIRQMCDIYREAYVTIVAANATRASDGFLDRQKTPGRPTRIPFWAADGKLSWVCVQEEGWYNDDEEPINTRCWTLQERLLSHRLVIYASHTVQLQCQHGIFNFDDSVNIPSGMGSWRLPSDLLNFPTEAKANDLAPEAIMEIWKRVITQYSARRLKRVEERLVALSGLALAFSRVLPLSYLAGLWSGPTLPLMLLWEVNQSEIREAYQTYVAPSWSWASLSTPVRYRNAHRLSTMRAFEVEILSATTQLQDSVLPLGKVSAGRIVLKAYVQQAKLAPPADLAWKDFAGPQPARPPIPPIGIYPSDYVLPDIQTDVRLDDQILFPVMDVVCLALALRSYEYDGVQYTAVDGLLLQRTGREELPLEFQRIGCFYGAMQEEFLGCGREEVALV